MKASSAPKPPTLRGVGVYIFDDEGRVLLAQRGPKARHEQYKWEGPGGAAEDGEGYEDAARREIREELGVDVKLGEVFFEYDHLVDVNGHVWAAKIFKGKIYDTPAVQEPEKCIGFGWFSQEEVARLSLADYTIKDLEALGWL